MKKIENHIGSAQKLSCTGNINYCLWVDETGDLYVQMTENDGESGTFSKNLFSVSKYHHIRTSDDDIRDLESFNYEKQITETVNNKNNKGFLKAVLMHLLPNNE